MTTTVRVTTGLLRGGADAPVPTRQPGRRPELRLVAGRPRRRLVGVVVTLASLALFASLFGLAVFHAMLVGGQSTIDDLEAELVTARAETEQLRLEVADLEAPERVLSVAGEDLGMVSPSEVITLTPPADPPSPPPVVPAPGTQAAGAGEG
jgi:cell division protein FtsL